MKNKALYISMFALLLIFLWIPIVQKEFGIFHVKPLKGVLIETPKPQLTLETYASGEFQRDCEGYVSENFGLREPVIRLYNQYAWSLFHKNFNVYFVPGKKNWIFYLPAVRDYYGQEQPRKFETKEKAIDFIDNEVDLMCTLRDSLKHYNVEFLSYMSPDKVFIYPEYMPTAHWKHDTTTLNGSEYFSEKLEEAGFPNIDMTKWFIQMKDTIDYQLFKRMNFHWEFSAAFAYDSLFRMMSDLNGLNIPKIKIDSLTTYIDDQVQNDEEMLNLMFHIKDPTLQRQAHVSVQCDSCYKPKVLFISDSFIWAFNEQLPEKELVEHKEVWYYNTTSFDGFELERHDLNDLNRLRRVLRADYVIFSACSHQWYDGTMGFAKGILEDLNDRELVKLSLTMNEIEADTNWIKALKIQTELLSEPLEKVLEIEALNVINGNHLLKDDTEVSDEALFNAKVARIKKELRNNPEAMESIEKKAKERGCSVEEMLELDAQWVVNYQNNKNK